MTKPNRPLEGLRILIVDDEPELRELIAEEMDYSGAKVKQASGGREALDILKNNLMDVVLSDVRMPNGDGVELLENAMKLPNRLCFILITGFADITEAQALQKGAVALFTKPTDWDALIQKIVDNTRRV